MFMTSGFFPLQLVQSAVEKGHALLKKRTKKNAENPNMEGLFYLPPPPRAKWWRKHRQICTEKKTSSTTKDHFYSI